MDLFLKLLDCLLIHINLSKSSNLFVQVGGEVLHLESNGTKNHKIENAQAKGTSCKYETNTRTFNQFVMIIKNSHELSQLGILY